jgi:DNA-binding transcriptional MerR regulator
MEDIARQAGNAGEGGLWFTVKQAATFTGRRVDTIYSWERRGILTDPKHDEYGRRIYSQQQIAAAEKKVRDRAQRILGRAA